MKKTLTMTPGREGSQQIHWRKSKNQRGLEKPFFRTCRSTFHSTLYALCCICATVCTRRSIGQIPQRSETNSLSNTAAHAGYAGPALALDWPWQLLHPGGKAVPGRRPYKSENVLVKEIKQQLGLGLERSGGKTPQVLVIFALGRCGKGAVDL